MDAARASIRMGASKVKILYRRDLASMPASEEELQDAINDGVETIYQTRVTNAIYEPVGAGRSASALVRGGTTMKNNKGISLLALLLIIVVIAIVIVVAVRYS